MYPGGVSLWSETVTTTRSGRGAQTDRSLAGQGEAAAAAGAGARGGEDGCLDCAVCGVRFTVARSLVCFRIEDNMEV